MKTIICIEDEEDIRESISEELKDAGFRVIEASNGLEGLEAIQKHAPDLVLCDINMPVMDGSALLLELRKNFPDLAEVPFVFLSANADRRFVVAGKELGADDYLTKPIDFDLLIATINSRLRQVDRIHEKHERQLVQTQKMEAIGRLTSGVSHEFNNLLTAIRGFSEIASRNLDKKDLVKECLDDVIDAADRAAAVTSQLLAFSRKHYSEKKIVETKDILNDLQRLLASMVGQKIELQISSPSESALLNVDPKLFSQVIINLALNARDALPDGGFIKIGAEPYELTDEMILEFPEPLEPGRYVCFSVTDNGTGMEEGMIDEIFEPFFTTKEEGQGTGLGLSVAYGLVRQSSGVIDCQSELGKGTTFRIFIPEAEDNPSVIRAADAAPNALPDVSPTLNPLQPAEKKLARNKGQETILIIEDETIVRDSMKGVLEEAGFKVVTASNEEGTREIINGQSAKIDLVLCDVILPGMDGPDLLEKIGKPITDLKVIYMSGNYMEMGRKYPDLCENDDFLAKPFTPSDLEKKVLSALYH